MSKDIVDDKIETLKCITKEQPKGLGKEKKTTNIDNIFSDVDDFIKTFEQEKEEKPRIPQSGLLELRMKLIQEEWDEIQEAVANDNLVEYVDGCLDLIYVVAGALLAAGIPANDSKTLWDMVHASNMAKAGGPKDENGKMLKPAGWQPPNIKGYLESLNKKYTMDVTELE